MFIKLGEQIEINKIESSESCIPSISPEILENFSKFATNLKKIAPKAEDFLYFSAVIMHSAEAAALNDDGTLKVNASGELIEVGWNKSGGTWRWTSTDKSIKPYRNSNGDIFPEEELIKAHKKWVGKPLCIDHKSSSVDHTRGFIVDTYYDRNLKRVVALCALDKANYPDLARKVSTGMQTAVSMGTAVGKAICSDCAVVARTEQDFCDHMRRKSGYGEINVDLNPIELSIVVNGADPKANIKTIIAAANTLNSYVESKSNELNKLAKKMFHGTFSVNDVNSSPDDDAQSTEINIHSDDLDKFKADMDSAFQKLQEINDSVNISEKDTNDLAFNQSSGSIAMENSADPTTDSGLAPPHERYASANLETESLKELRETTKVIEQKLSQMKVSLDKLANSNTQEENMSGSEINKKGYFQGTEEPKPGQVQYPKDPMNEKVRDSEDKHMLDQDTGPVDGLHPGDLERKKMLARATAEERAMRREAIVNLAKDALKNKEAYFQGGGGVNEPAPGKVKYPAEKLNEQLRDHEDKHMVGQKPFPGVGSVDGLHPSPDSSDVSDEKKRKELLQRASLRARFVKAANSDGTQNVGKSAWEVFLGDKLLLTASVNDLSGNRAEMLYDSIATKEFGAKLIEKVKVQGADKVRSLVKSAQELPPPAPVAAPAPADLAAPAELPAEDTGAEGDPKANVTELSEKVRDLSSDLVEAVRALTGEQAEMGDLEGGLGAAASDGSSLNTIRRELNGALTAAIKETVAELAQHQEELDLITGLYEKDAVSPSNESLVLAVADDVVNESKKAIAEGFNLLSAFVKYARGTKAIVKRAEIEAELNALADGDSMNDENNNDDLMSLIQDTNADLDAVKDMMDDGDKEDFDDEKTYHGPGHVNDHDEDLYELLGDNEAADDNDLQAKPEELKNLEVKPGTEVHVVASADFDSKEGRAVLRAKLAADALKVSPLLHDAHPKGGFTTELDVKPTGDLAKVEDLEETHDAMMDLANAPPKVRKEAEAIHKLVSEGKLEVSDLDALVAEGLDKDAVSYYKKFYSQVDGGSEFASELVKEHVKAELEEQLNTFKVKMARAYELTYNMIERGLCQADAVSRDAQVEEIMKFNDDSFDSLKRVVAKHSPIAKVAGRMPQVGMIGSGDVNSVNAGSDDDLYSQLTSALSTSNKRNF